MTSTHRPITDWRSIIRNGPPVTSTTASQPMLSAGEPSQPTASTSTYQFAKSNHARLECRISFDTGPNWSSQPGRQGKVTITICTEALESSVFELLPETVFAQILDGGEQINLLDAVDKCSEGNEAESIIREQVPATQYHPLGEELWLDSDSIASDADSTLVVHFTDRSGTQLTVEADIVRVECFKPGESSTVCQGPQTMTPPTTPHD